MVTTVLSHLIYYSNSISEISPLHPEKPGLRSKRQGKMILVVSSEVRHVLNMVNEIEKSQYLTPMLA